ncbi:DNA-dependent metalloprotease dvc-1 isoform X2 [Chironomus tepperi]
MYQCAGICYSRRSRGQMSCIIRLSEPLLKLRSRKELVETLLHEMIHAFNFIRGILEENGGHGKNFLAKMHEINRLAGTNITVYHTFHDEVELYKKHWWRCDGPCRTQKPYFGYVKRTSNRAPSKNDFWWSQHMQKCGGTFIKVKEPEKVEKKKTREVKPKSDGPTKRKVPVKAKDPNPKDQKPKDNDIRKFFPNISLNTSSDFSEPDIDKIIQGPSTSKAITSGEPDKIKIIPDSQGTKLGGSGSGRSRLLDMFNTKKDPPGTSAAKRPKLEVIEIKSEIPEHQIHKSIKIEVMHEFDDDDDIILIDDQFDDSIAIDYNPIDIKEEVKIKNEDEPTTCECPICNKKINVNEVNQHLDECLTIQMLKESP